MEPVVTNTLILQPNNYSLVPARDRYYIDRLSTLSEQAIDESVRLQEGAQLVVISLLEDVEQMLEKSPKLSPQKERLIEVCLHNCLLEIMEVLKRTNREMHYILLRAEADMDDEFVVRKLYNFFKWYVQN